MSSQSNSGELLPEAPLRHTLFHIPPVIPIKNASSSYMKTDGQTIWARGPPLGKPAASSAQMGQSSLPSDAPRGSDVLIIHPGSRWLRLGRASDPFPVSIPHVIARKQSSPQAAADFNPPPLSRIPTPGSPNKNDGQDAIYTQAEIEENVSTIRSALVSRMDFYKIPYDPEASASCAEFNDTPGQPETIDESKDVYRVDWVAGEQQEKVFIGHKVFRIADPAASGYVVRWPLYGNHFNTREYESLQGVLSDLEVLWEIIIGLELNITRRQFKEYSVILLIPDFFDKNCVSELVTLLLVQMRFKRVAVVQEGYGAALGAGLTTACVVDVGAVKTSISCIEDGLVLSDTRMFLDFGGDDITEFLHNMLAGINFPYRDINLNRLYDLHVMDDLKARLCTLSEADVEVRTYDFFVRAPGRPTQKYIVRAYDETIVAAMCIFEPKIIDFDAKKRVNPSRWHIENIETSDLGSDNPTSAMVISTQHLLPPPQVLPDGTTVPPPITIDMKFEAAKLPLDVAIFNSVRAAGVDKIKRFLQSVVIIGGTALIPGMIHALESRLQAIAFPLIPGIERLSVMTAPPEIDPRVLAWKGAAILSRLDQFNEMWISEGEWDVLGMRALKERSLIDRPSNN
ncbi:actin-like protein arp8 [Tulasnella sp. 418]|nr:actin-like protein arp8 [Tulasnella sp. 418]